MERKVTGKCVDYTHDGKGVVKIDRIPIFIENLIKDEEADILITKKDKGFNLGKVEKLLSVSKNRCKPICENYKYCGGCNLQHMKYEEQLSFKRKRVEDVLKHIGGVEVSVPDVLGMEDPYKYRNKVQVPIGMSFDGRVIGGFYQKGSHQIINMEKCYIEDEEADKVLETLKKLFNKFEVEPCDIYSNTGLVRYVIIRRSYLNGDMMVVIVTRTKQFPKIKNIITELKDKHKNVKTVVQNINNRRTSKVLGDIEYVLDGPGYIEDEILGLKFKISAKSFYQVNPKQTIVLYSKAMEFANLTKKDRVLDAYCGVGTIGLIAARNAKEVVGVEIVKEAIVDAKKNAINNGINNATFYALDAADYMVDKRRKKDEFDVVFVDPPRDGCSQKFIKALLTMAPKRIVYISCDPSSLARDLKQLKHAYSLEKIQCVDMFPQTYHVETVTLLIHTENSDN
ncbi:MAG: 23S rRNA (uracil(1939)-C(5))-methyltransferase RlmD [Bacilli bacterium]|nr:23S rRNA (uracil(1939)-C(5))-methyltransferase RlmD [Bacilli bacterium]